MFGRGNWAVIGLKSESLDAFKATLNTHHVMLANSQLAASAVTRHQKRDTVGINPYRHPRMDEQEDAQLSLAAESELATYATTPLDGRNTLAAPGECRSGVHYANTDTSFAIAGDSGLYGFWLVLNVWKDVSHAATLREQRSYDGFLRPGAFLSPVDKKAVNEAVIPVTGSIRKQVPVILDFNRGFVYIEATGKNEILAAQDLLDNLGAEIFSVAWKFDVEGNWPSKFLTKLYADTWYADEFQKRAEELQRFRSDEIEKGDNPEIEKLISKFFSTTDGGNELWVSLSGPAGIALNPTTAPISVATPTNATILMKMAQDASIRSASVTLQERRTSYNKKTETEKVFRVDQLTFDINDNINVVEVGAALLRGFDIPGFKKQIMKQIRQTKQVPPIEDFWRDWVIQMGQGIGLIGVTIAEFLELDNRINQTPWGIQPLYVGGSEEVIEEAE